MPTIKDVAKAAQVSVATVSRVLNHDKNVSPQTRQRVLEVVRQVGYTPNMLGRNLRRKNTERVLVLIPSLSNQFLSGVIRGVESAAKEKDLQVMISATHNDKAVEEGYLEMLYNRSVDGIILVGSTLEEQEISRLAGQYPLVMCSEWIEGAAVSAVGINNEQAAFDAVSALLSGGRRKIAIVSNEEVYSARLRTQGYRRALAQAGIPYRPEYEVEHYEYTYRAGMRACRKLMALPEPPDAIFAVSDELAAGVCKALIEQEIIPGREVDVFGFDNTTMSKVVTPSISTVSQPRKKIGEMALQLLWERMEHPEEKNRLILLPHELVLRASSRGNQTGKQGGTPCI